MSDDAVIEQVRRYLVPVAVNLYVIRAATDSGGALFRLIQQQRPQYQGIWIVSPDGRVLAAHSEVASGPTWTQQVLQTIDTARGKAGALSPRRMTSIEDPLPHRGVGLLPSGGVSLALYTRYIRGGGKDRAAAEVHADSLWLWDGPVRPDGPPTIDSISLSAGEWATFAPHSRTPGQEWVLPDSVARRFCRALSPASDQSTMPRPEETTLDQLKATVVSVEGTQISVALNGKWAACHEYDGKPSYAWSTATGTLVYDSTTHSVRSITMVFHGTYRMAPPYDREDRPIGAVVEWHGSTLGSASR